MHSRVRYVSKVDSRFLIVLGVLLLCACQKDEMLTRQGYQAYLEADYDKAIQCFDIALAANPSNADSYLGRGNSWAEKKDYAKALEDYDKAIAIDPSFARGYYARAYLWSEMNNISNAIADYTKAIDLNPRYISAYINRADLFKRVGQNDLALNDYTTVLTLSPDDAGALQSRGYVLVTLGRYDEAIIDYSKAIDIDPKDPQAFIGRADAWYELENYEKAAHDCEKAIELHSADPMPYSNLAWILATCPNARYRDGRRAIKMAQKALEIVLSSHARNYLPDVYDTLAAAYAETRLFDLAIHYQAQAIQHAKAPGQTNLSHYEMHMKLYREGKPLRIQKRLP